MNYKIGVKVMKCIVFENGSMIEGYVKGKLSSFEKEEFEGHLLECKECSKAVISLVKTIKYLKSVREIIEEGETYLSDKKYKEAAISFENALRKDSKNVEAQELLRQCEEIISEKKRVVYKFIKEFFTNFYPNELKTFEIYWKEISRHKNFDIVKDFSTSAYGWAFSGEEKDQALMILEIMLHLMDKGLEEKRNWGKRKLENWIRKEIKKKGGRKQLRDKIIEYVIASI